MTWNYQPILIPDAPAPPAGGDALIIRRRKRMNEQAFTPAANVQVTAASGASSAAVALGLPISAQRGGAMVRIASIGGGNVARIRFGASDVVALVTDMPILSGSVEFFCVPQGATHIAAYGVGGTQLLDVTSGFGA